MCVFFVFKYQYWILLKESYRCCCLQKFTLALSPTSLPGDTLLNVQVSSSKPSKGESSIPQGKRLSWIGILINWKSVLQKQKHIVSAGCYVVTNLELYYAAGSFCYANVILLSCSYYSTGWKQSLLHLLECIKYKKKKKDLVSKIFRQIACYTDHYLQNAKAYSQAPVKNPSGWLFKFTFFFC